MIIEVIVSRIARVEADKTKDYQPYGQEPIEHPHVDLHPLGDGNIQGPAPRSIRERAGRRSGSQPYTDSGKKRASSMRGRPQREPEGWTRARCGCACETWTRRWRSRRANARFRRSTQLGRRAAQERERRGCSDDGCEIRPGGT
jgi:hypothetical protein